MSKWKSLPLEGDLKVKGFQEGLVGIETLGTYSILTKGGKKPSKVKETGGKGVKRTPETETESAPPKKKKKTRQKRKPKDRKKLKKETPKEEPEPADEAEDGDDKDDQDEANEKEEAPASSPSKPSAWSSLFAADSISKALLDLDMTSPTPIQSAVLPAAIKGRRDIVGAAETGIADGYFSYCSLKYFFNLK